jgi:uncharacterized Rmd1/YagE family protein
MIKPLYERMRISYKASLYRDVLYLLVDKEGHKFEAFFFPYGVSVFWGTSKELGLRMIQEEVQSLEEFHSDDVEIDLFTYIYGDAARIVEDEITLPNHDVLTKLAISHGIAQSVKLATFESSIQKTYNSTKTIPQNLYMQGKIPLSRKEIRRKMGELFLARNSINLHMDVLDTPEFFWEYPELEPLYKLAANYLDISARVEVLNQRMDVIQGLFVMLGNELNHLHSSRLEMTIILLIVIEVLIALMRDIFHLI